MATVDFNSLRQIHLDFHTPGFVTVGDQFDADEFGDTLVAAGVNAITVFATCHHGYSYFPTTVGRQHPGLSFDLMGEQIEACRRRDIQVLAYFSLNVNEVQAAAHPEWHAVRRDGRPANDQILKDGTMLYWQWLCQNRAPWAEEFFYPHVREVLTAYDVDGVFVDMVCYLPETCYCDACRERLAARGLDPDNTVHHETFNLETMQAFDRRLRQVMDDVKPGLRLNCAGFHAYGHGHKGKGVISDFYLESLAYQTGWQYLPTAARYYRNTGVPAMGMTGRFLRNWGDFGTVVSARQLKTQLAMHLMAGLPSGIGDHLHCNGKLNPAVYATIGEAYEWLARRQPHVVGMAPAREVAVLTPNAGASNAATMEKQNTASPTDGFNGACKVLPELHYQYDVISTHEALDEFAVLVVTHPDFDDAYTARVRAWVEAGGTLVVSGLGCLGGAAWRDLAGIAAAAPAAHQGEFWELTDPDLAGPDIPAMPNYVHAAALDVEFTAAMQPLAAAWRSPCVRQRGRHYGHFHGPATDPAGTAVAWRQVGAGRVVTIRPLLFNGYLNSGYLAHRALIAGLLERFVPADRRVLRTNAPTLVEFAVGRKSGRLLVQALPFVADKRHMTSFEAANETVPFHDIWVELPGVTGTARNALTGAAIPAAVVDGALRLHLPPFAEHVLIAVEPA